MFAKTLPIMTMLAAAGLSARAGQPADSPAPPPVARAVQSEIVPVLDGDVLNDPAWEAVPASSGFWQTRPFEGQPASEKTEVRIIYTRDTLYFGVVCYDSEPGQIIVSDSRRDSPLDETDAFRIILDTYLDRQNGFVFGTNPAGIEYDGQVANQGEGADPGPGRQQAGAGGGFNINWDGSWEVETRISDIGWSAEFAIPFRTLRYPSRPLQDWGVNFQRNIRRKNEIVYWAPLPRQYTLFRLSLAGRLEGLEIPEQQNLKLIPYVLGRVHDQGQSGDAAWTGDAGMDLKYSLTSSLTLDVTYNTDFAQVEVDEQQINLDRFNLFFPEKRPFFLENAGLFAVGNPSEVELFFSRRIGIGPEGIPIPILGGARLTGRLRGLNVGFLNMQTEEIEGLAPGNNFSVARLRQDFPNRTYLGGIFINRQGTGDGAADQDFNRTFGLDGRWGIGRFGEVSGFLAGTSTPGTEQDEYAYRVGAFYNSEAWRLDAQYAQVSDAFNPEVGFLERRGYRKPSFTIFHTARPRDILGLHEIRPHVSYRGFWNFEGFQETGFLHVDNHLEWRNGYEFHTGINFTRQGVVEPFEIFDEVVVLPGTYDHQEAQLVFNTNQAAPVSFEMRSTIGGFFGGDRLSLTPSLSARIGETFKTDLSLSRNDVELPVGNFVTHLALARISYSFNPRVFVQSLFQYNDRADIWAMNIRFGWLQAANTGVFVVYNDTRGFSGFDPLLLPDRSLTIKINRIFELLD